MATAPEIKLYISLPRKGKGEEGEGGALLRTNLVERVLFRSYHDHHHDGYVKRARERHYYEFFFLFENKKTTAGVP